MNEAMIDQSWTLFLDRDGVINKRIVADYVRKPHQFEWLPGVLPALKYLTTLFGRTVVVTNQQGVGKGLMTIDDLDIIHSKMRQQALFEHAKIDAVYACTDLANSGSKCRKPETGMAEQARTDFPEISWEKSVMVGDSLSDIAFGQRCGMQTIFIGRSNSEMVTKQYDNLWDFANELSCFMLVG